MNIFTEHPEEVGESYFQHFRVAAKVGSYLLFAGICCMIHSVFPFMFTRTASSTIKTIQKLLDRNSTV